MERLDRIASHGGRVLSVRNGMVEVQIEAVSACASCAAHAKCGFAESKDKKVEVPSAAWQSFEPGQPVVVHIDESRGLLAVWIAYVLPALLMLAAIVGVSLAGGPEWAAVLAGFAVLAAYIGVVYLRRRKVEGRFTLTVDHA
ncbi:MAG: SoxR reducing system RseC family protein [Bacteroidales bacterium]|nr:SoxR reducing system RseC family protein [Bacteroidales bacterium]